MKVNNVSLNKKWSTHMPMLIKIVSMTKGPIVELGAGVYSTPLLHWLCFKDKRLLYTYENSEFFFNFAKEFQSRNHRICWTEDFSEVDIKKHWSVIFIDNSPDESRSINAIRLKDSADYIILHDSEQIGPKGYEDIWEHFKYRYDWKGTIPWTSVVSNFKNLSNL